MNKIDFENLPSTNTPINATNLNLMQTNIENAIDGLITSASGKIVIGNIGIEWGSKTVTSESSGSTSGGVTIYSGETSVTFLNNYSSSPTVLTSWRSGYTNQISTTAPGITTTGCNVRGYMLTANASRTINYLVIGNI